MLEGEIPANQTSTRPMPSEQTHPPKPPGWIEARPEGVAGGSVMLVVVRLART